MLRCLLPLCLASAALAACRGGGAAPPSARGAPVLLISIDTLRADRLPAYGYRGVQTPHIDRLQRDALLFEDAYSPCPMTLPSHVTMLTGLLPPQHGVRNNVGFPFDPGAHPTLPGLLASRGYATGAAVSADVLRRQTGMGRAFGSYEDSIDPGAGAAFVEHQRPGTRTAALAKAWIDEHRGGPFFFFLHLYEPHVPYEPPEPFRSRYASPYDGEVAAADAVIGDVLDHLRGLGLYERALVVLTSDHGEGLGDHGEDQHAILLYREAIRVPLLIKLPGPPGGGRRVAASAQLADLMPTLARLLGVAAPPGLPGIDLLGPGAAAARPLYSETLYPRLHLGWSELRSVVQGRFHYIEGPRRELYDMVADPGETRDLASADPGRAAQLARAVAAVPAGALRPAAVDAEAAERVGALGYVGTVRDRGDAAALPHPRDQLPHLARLREGFRLASERRYEEAAAALGAIVREEPGMVEAWIRLGEVLSEIGRHQEAAASFQQALARSGVAMGDVIVALGYARLRAGRTADAEAEARRALALVPEQAHGLLARAALARGRGEEAVGHARAGLEAGPPRPSALLLLAEVLTANGRVGEALAALSQAEACAAEAQMDAVPRLEFLRADALARSGRPAEAEAAYRREVQRFPSHLQAHANLAVLLWLLGRPAEARAALAAMEKANPGPRARALAARTLATLSGGARARPPGTT